VDSCYGVVKDVFMDFYCIALPRPDVSENVLSPLIKASSGMLRRVTVVRTDVSDEFSASFIRLTRIGELALLLVHRFLSH
jgi:hypothetical protein